MSAIQAERGSDDVAKKFAIFSSKMSQTRANLRLFDDLPMIQYSKDYGWGDKEPDRLMASIGVLTNIVDHVYYPVDKVCWLIEQNILKVKNADRWDTLNSIFWVTSIYLNLMKWVLPSNPQKLQLYLITFNHPTSVDFFSHFISSLSVNVSSYQVFERCADFAQSKTCFDLFPLLSNLWVEMLREFHHN